MKTTLDVPDDVFREAKVRAAVTGAKLKDLVAEGLRQALASPPPGKRAASQRATPRGKRPSVPPAQARGQGRLVTTNEMIAELDDEALVRRAFGGRYRLRQAPVRVTDGNEIRPLTNEETAGLLDPAFALAEGLTLVTFDAGMRSFPHLEVLLLAPTKNQRQEG